MSTATAESEVAVTTNEAKSSDGRGRKARKDFEVPEGGFTAVPEWYNPKVHKALQSSHFKDEAVFLDWKGDELIRKGKKYKKDAEQLRELGSVEDRKKAARLQKIQSEMADLVASLKESGVDVAKFMGG